MTSHRIPAVLAAAATAFFLAACSTGTGTTAGDGHTDHDHETSETAVISVDPAGFDPDDVAFATNMIPHHQQAIELSALVPDRSTNAEVLTLARQISAAQQPEIETMKAFLVQWNENPQDSAGQDTHGGHGGHGGMAGMVDDATMAKLKTLNGPEFDTLWLQSMVAHHQGAVEMAKAEVANGKNVDAQALAEGIIAAQQAEIDQMQKMLAGAP